MAALADRFGLEYYLQSGHAGAEETFAELAAQMMGGGADPQDLVRRFPRCSTVIRGLLS